MLSIVVPVYYNEGNLVPLYEDLKQKVLDVVDYECEVVLVDDGSEDGSWDVMRGLARRDPRVRVYRLSRNFGSHAAILCGLERCEGDCAMVKAADLQEPTEMIHDMVASWREGNNVVLAVRTGREEGRAQTTFANLYYWMTRKAALPAMPKGGFDTYLVDRKVIDVLCALDERNSALTGQILWSGFRTAQVEYVRREREVGKSRWTLRKKVRLVSDTLFSFSKVPVTAVELVGVLSFVVGLVWAVVVLVNRLFGNIPAEGFTTLFIFMLLSFGVVMVTLGVLGEYLWRTFDAARGRPPYIVEEEPADVDEAVRDEHHRRGSI